MNKLGTYRHMINDEDGTITHIMWQNGKAFCTISLARGFDHYRQRLTNSSTLVISNLNVATEFRRQGIGRELLDYVEEEAIELRCKETAVWVDSKNKMLRDMYENRGYVSTHFEYGYYLMKKYLR